MRMRQTALCTLREGFGRLSNDGSMQDCLEKLSQLTAAIVGAQHCAIVLLGEDDALAAGLCAETRFGAFSPAHAAAATAHKEDMTAALVLQGTTVGALHVRKPLRRQAFDTDDLHVLSIVAPLVARSIQAFQLQKILDSRFTQIALSKTRAPTIGRMMAGAVDHPERIARLLARSFYREMLTAGFDSNQILFAATEVISELSASLRKHGAKRKERAGRNGNIPEVPLSDSAAAIAILEEFRIDPDGVPVLVQENAD